MTRPDIICMATRRLDNPMPTNVQHLMLRLASTHRVLYVEPPVDPVFLLRGRGAPRLPPAVEPPSGLHVLSPTVLPWAHRWERIGKWNNALLARQIRRAAARLCFDRPLLWLFSPLHADVLGRLGEQRVCYHVTDDYRSMPWASAPGVRAAVEAREETILQVADHVFVTSARLAADRGLSGDRFVVVPNVADVEHFAGAAHPATRVAADVAAIEGPIAGFFGAIDDYKVDFELLAAAARATPEVTYLLIGPCGWADGAVVPESLRLPNVLLIGPRPYAELPSYLKAFDVALIPYRITEYTRYCSPLKLYEYLAAGKPVVTTDLPGVREAGDFVTIAADPDAFATAIRARLADVDRDRRARAAFAAQHSWAGRVAQIEKVLVDA